MQTRVPYLLLVSCALMGCADLTSLDSAISDNVRKTQAPELQPRSHLDLETPDTETAMQETETLLARGARLQSRADALR